jgi:phage host-nuclease inhibitor protein Gam
MNLIETIKDQLSGASMSRLSSLIGAGEETTRTAVGAAVPALLSALSNVASSSEGAQKVAAALNKVDARTASDVGNMLTQDPEAVQELGSGMLNSLLGGSTVSGIVNAVSRYAGIGGAAVQKLLGYVMPLLMGVLAGRLGSRAATAQGLTSALEEQKANIARAVPSGLSLPSLPGVSGLGQAAQTAAAGAQTAGSSALKWLVPALALAAIAVIIWFVTRPGAPDVTKLSGDLSGTFTSLSGELEKVKDATTAEKAAPNIKELVAKVEAMKAQVDKLPEADKKKITELITTKLAAVRDKAAEALTLPGGDKIKPALDGFMTKVAALGGVQPPDLSVPAVPQLAQIRKDITGTIKSLTGELEGIKDAVTGEKVGAKLKELVGKVEEMKAAVARLPEADRAKITEQIQTSLAALRDKAAAALAAGGAKIKPALEGVMSKVADLGGLKVPELTVPAIPQFAELNKDLTGTIKSLTGALTDIKDAATAKAAAPTLTDLVARVEAMKAHVEKLPAEEKGKIRELIKTSLGNLEEQYAKLPWVAGAGEKTRMAADEVLGRLASLGGVEVPQVPQLSGKLASTFSSLTQTLTSIKDAATAKTALPQLATLDKELEGVKAAMAKLPESSKSTIGELIRTAVAALQKHANQILNMEGVGPTVRPVVEGILTRLKAIGG